MSSHVLLRGVVLLVWLAGSLLSAENSELRLPQPTGPFAVGRTTVVAVGASRGARPVRVDVWYPALAEKARAEYVPDVSTLLQDPRAARQLHELYGPSATLVTGGHVLSNSWFNAPVASGGPFPLLLFLPGLGMPTFVYTAQLEELASRGFVVAAVSPPGDAAPTVVEGKAVPFNDELWAKHPAAYGSSQFYADRAQEWANDLISALDTLVGMARDRKSLFANSIDPARIGAFGHSQGGRSAAAACMLDRRLRACLNEDGRYDDDNLLRPYWPIDGRQFHGSFAMLDWFDPGLGSEDLAAMHTDLAAYAKSHLRPPPAARAAYTAVKGGAFRLTIVEPGMAHTAFTDLPYLRAPTAGKRSEAARRLGIIQTATAEFFDWKLGRGKPLTTECDSIEEGVLVQCFLPTKAH